VTWLLAAVALAGVSASGPLMAAIAAPALVIAFWRNAAATAVLAPFALRRSADLRGLRWADLRGTVFAGVMLAVHFAAWVGALKLTTVAAATALTCTQLVWVVAIDRLRGVRPGPAVGLGCTVAVVGVLVVSGVDLTVSTRALVGDLLAVVGGLGAALYLVAGESARRRLSTTHYTTLCYGTCALVLALACAVTGTSLVGYEPRVWLLLAAVTVCAQLLGHSLFNHLLAVMSPTVISLVLLLEVPAAALLAAAFLGQAPPLGVYAGLLLVLAGLVVVVRARRLPDDVVEPVA
jgi:drug/metabolite transporter (DMT)-like permease